MPNQHTGKAPLEPRFWAKVDKRGPDECWLWTGALGGPGYRTGTGYGQFPHPGGRIAHRYAYELLIGPIPEGLELDHLCRKPACVNPAHLEPVTHRENIRRGMSVFGINARKTHCNSGHPYDEANTIWEPKGTRRCRTCKNLRRQEHYWRNPEKFRARERARRANA